MLPSDAFELRDSAKENATNADSVLAQANTLAFIIILLSLKMALRAHLVSRAIRITTIPPKTHARILATEKILMEVSGFIVCWVKTRVLS